MEIDISGCPTILSRLPTVNSRRLTTGHLPRVETSSTDPSDEVLSVDSPSSRTGTVSVRCRKRGEPSQVDPIPSIETFILRSQLKLQGHHCSTGKVQG